MWRSRRYLYAVSAGSGRKARDTTASLTNAVVAAAPSAGYLRAAIAVSNGWCGLLRWLLRSVSAGPKIQFATPIYDFGKVKSGEAVKYTYVFTNMGGATLQVSNVQALVRLHDRRRVDPAG